MGIGKNENDFEGRKDKIRGSDLKDLAFRKFTGEKITNLWSYSYNFCFFKLSVMDLIRENIIIHEIIMFSLND